MKSIIRGEKQWNRQKNDEYTGVRFFQTDRQTDGQNYYDNIAMSVTCLVNVFLAAFASPHPFTDRFFSVS